LFPASLAPLVRAAFGATPKTGPLPLGGAADEASSSPLSPWERAGVREQSLARETEKNNLSSAAISPHPNPLARGEGMNPPHPIPNTLSATLTSLDDWLWQTEDAEGLLMKQFGVRSLDGYGLTRKKEAIAAAAACLRYAQETQRAVAAHISDIVYFEPQ